MNWKKILPFLILTALGGLFGYFVGSYLGKDSDGPDDYSKLQLGFLLLYLPFMYFIVVGWHELGHVLTGLTQRFRFMSLTVGPFAWKRRRDRIHFAWNKSINLSGGLAYMLPQGDDNMARRFATFAAGGPGASLVLAGLGLALSVILPAGSTAELLLGATGWLSLLIFALTIAPFRAGGFSSDGRRILTLLGKSEAARHEVTLLRIIAFTQSARPLSELPIAAIEAGIESEVVTPQYRALFEYYRYLYFLNAGELNNAETALTAFTDGLDTFPPGLREGYYLDSLLFYAFEREDLDRALEDKARFRKSTFTQDLEVELAKAGLARLRGKQDVAAAAAERLAVQIEEEIQEPAKLPIYHRWLAVLSTPYQPEEEE